MNGLRALLRNENDIDFPAYWKRVGIVSATLLLIAIGSLVFRGLNLGIEFEGGTVWEAPTNGVEADEISSALSAEGIDADRVQVVGGDTFRIRSEETRPTAFARSRDAGLMLHDTGTGTGRLRTIR